ncbi:MAG: peptide-methionine (R)-S-oxide reductase MsrB [Taibaiella sp.]|nr:peptide-methionine (R)-S-oxide reductase MsrB [Taibaiella sp.]
MNRIYFMKSASIIFSLLIAILASGCVNAQPREKNQYYSHTDNGQLRVSDAEWKKILPSEAYHILREKGTESPNTSPYVHNPKKGTYYCAACGHTLFSSTTKFDSGTGWPSFYQPMSKTSVAENVDKAHGMTRTEVVCARCGGHLGHVFDDGPNPTGLRYCMNGYAMTFEASK